MIQNPDQSVHAMIPDRALGCHSVQIDASSKRFSNWTLDDHGNSYSLLQRIITAWRIGQFATQYLLYGKVEDNKPFRWEAVPCKPCQTFIGRAIFQISVLWRVVFGGAKVSEKRRSKELQSYRSWEKMSEKTNPCCSAKKEDSFCKRDVIDRQWVVTGEKVNVLYNYAPIGLGGERLHFLVIPKEHRTSFSDVTENEYRESLDLTSKLITHLKSTRSIESVYLLHKTGIDAGQTVPHWHLHVIASTNKRQDFWGKLTVLKNILFGSRPLKPKELEGRVISLRNELS